MFRAKNQSAREIENSVVAPLCSQLLQIGDMNFGIISKKNRIEAELRQNVMQQI